MDEALSVSESLDSDLVEIKGAFQEAMVLGGASEDNELFASNRGIFELDDLEFVPSGDELNLFAYQDSPFFPAGEDVDGLNLKEHFVEAGETPSSIAKKYNISVETILSANDLRYGDYIVPGEVLIVLPVSGILHKVQASDTIEKLSQAYKASFEETVKYNFLPADGTDLPVGDYIIIPDGTKYIGVAPPAYGKKLAEYDNYYVFPTTGRNWGRLHTGNAVDIANSCGTEVYAAASGRVVQVETTDSRSPGAFSGYGNNITLAHDNGTKTRYAHLLAALVSEGDTVSKGSIIAWMGGRPYSAGAGRSTGCHLHFEVLGAKNPFVRY
ncbi:MAG: peptidoglycan DD-metalloendopeptidase family protein [Planctomycetota bacterium]